MPESLALPIAIALVVVAIALLVPAPSVDAYRALDERTSTIFVSVPSYRDTECARTVESMIRAASFPSRVFVGVYEQNAEASESCSTELAKLAGAVRVVSVGHERATGPCSARYQCAALMRDEDVYLQVDSHTTFAENWDVAAIATLRALPGAQEGRVVVSTYPVDCAAGWETADPPVIESAEHKGSWFVFSATGRPDARNRHARSRQIGGGFLLCVADVVRRVPLDPHLDGVFNEEELLFTARLFTHGIDVVAPRENLVCHKYSYAEHRTVWTDTPKWRDGTGGYARLRALLSGTHPDPFGPYAFGRARPISAFWDSAGISYRDAKALPWP
jgi:hypothetical protein